VILIGPEVGLAAVWSVFVTVAVVGVADIRGAGAKETPVCRGVREKYLAAVGCAVPAGLERHENTRLAAVETEVVQIAVGGVATEYVAHAVGAGNTRNAIECAAIVPAHSTVCDVVGRVCFAPVQEYTVGIASPRSTFSNGALSLSAVK
jgi:hypothetical protein